MTNQKIVIIEDNDDTFFLIKGLLKNIGYDDQSVVRCAQLHELDRIDPKDVGVVLTDLSLPDSPYRLTFKKVNDHFVYTPIIVLTGTAEVEVTNNILKAGAQDYLIKGEIDSRTLSKSIQYAIERKRMANDYKRLFLESPLPMYIFEKDTYRFLAANEAALRQYQYTRNEFVAMTALDIRPESEWERFYKVRKTMPDSYFDAGRWLHQRKNGEQFYVHVYAHPIEFEGKEATIVLANDIDARVKAEQELQEKTDQIEKILGSVGDGFITIQELTARFNTEDPADPVNATVINGINETVRKLDDVVKGVNGKAHDTITEKTD
ncbi:MAG: sensor protein [Flavipsychrobacter sp.]|jgi:PAS domain S-box-containing protein|nr:sensor protein [Flavipsychrobacter sp.]